jgi:hypothetical protein
MPPDQSRRGLEQVLRMVERAPVRVVEPVG